MFRKQPNVYSLAHFINIVSDDPEGRSIYAHDGSPIDVVHLEERLRGQVATFWRAGWT